MVQKNACQLCQQLYHQRRKLMESGLNLFSCYLLLKQVICCSRINFIISFIFIQGEEHRKDFQDLWKSSFQISSIMVKLTKNRCNPKRDGQEHLYPILQMVECKISSGAWDHSLYIDWWGTWELLVGIFYFLLQTWKIVSTSLFFHIMKN